MIIETKKIKTKSPFVLACWPGMGEVSYKAGLFLKESLAFEEFAYIDSQRFFLPQSVIVNKGVVNLPPLPEERFYIYKGKGKPLILFLSNSQPPADKYYGYAQGIVSFLKRFKPQEVFTFASIPQPIEHIQDYKVWLSSTHREILEKFKKYNLPLLNEGQIAGLNGLFLGICKEQGLKGVCLLGEIPLYTIQIENPKASKNILEIFCDYLGLKVDFSPLVERQRLLDEHIERLMEIIRSGGDLSQVSDRPLDEKDIENIKKDLSAFVKLPQSARKRIEELFKEAKENISKATILKQELDKWGVYQEYEDRFLDLFRKRKH